MLTNTSWQQGQSGNKDGRPPKGESITELMQEYLKKVPDGSNKSIKEMLVERIVHMAISKSNIHAIKLIIEYVDHSYLKSSPDHVCPIGTPIMGGLSSKSSQVV
jgi:hypothetical protein